jgi:hypothetical protein
MLAISLLKDKTHAMNLLLHDYMTLYSLINIILTMSTFYFLLLHILFYIDANVINQYILQYHHFCLQ